MIKYKHKFISKSGWQMFLGSIKYANKTKNFKHKRPIMLAKAYKLSCKITLHLGMLKFRLLEIKKQNPSL